METAIREGELRLLTSETQCDVVLSCQGCKLTAHKVILSIASSVLQELLLQDSADTTVLIFPDVKGTTMSLVLDYIYNGSAIVPACHLSEFLSIATLLNLHLNYDKQHTLPTSLKEAATNDEMPSNFSVRKCEETLNDFKENDTIHKKSIRKLPKLMPISSLKKSCVSSRKGLYNRVFPSPWCPRVVPLLADPREECLITNEHLLNTHPIEENYIKENDTNNNFQIRTQSYLPAATFKRSVYFEKKETISLNQDTDNDISTSPAHTEENEEQKLFIEKSIISKHDSKKPDFEDTDANDATLKTDSNESTANSRTLEMVQEASKKEKKTTKHKPFKCNDCGKCFSQLRNYKYHRSIHEGTREFAARCPECGKIFNDRGYLSSHLKIHRDRKEYACPNCPKRFNQRVAYNMHLRIHTGVKPHECPVCGKTFSRKMLLKQHQRVHTGERPYSCPECGKSFADRSNMSLHTRLHTGVKPYGCTLCPKSFTKKHHLKTHMNFHTGLKPYSCQKCGLSFSQSSNMRTHYKKCVLKSSSAVSIAESS